MRLPENVKLLIDQQIEKSQKEQLNALQVAKLGLENEVLKLADQVKALISKQQKTLTELNIYKWVIRVLSVLLLGGSILGLMTYQDYLDRRIDSRIAERVIKTDRLGLAVSKAYSGQWRGALQLLDKIWGDPTSSDLDPDFRSFLFVNYLWVLGQIQDVQPDGSWVGTAEWKRLNEDPHFLAEFITGNTWEHDADVNNSLGFCTLKFSNSNDLLQIARTYFQRAADDATPEQFKAPSIFALAMIDLIEGDAKAAADKMRKAEELYPEDYRISDRVTYRNTFVNSTEFQIWAGVSQRVKGKDFVKLYDKFLMGLNTQGKSSIQLQKELKPR